MPRMFDILKAKGGDYNAKNEDRPDDRRLADIKVEPETNARPLTFPREILKPYTKREDRNSEDHSLVSKKLISAVKMHGVDNHEKSRQIYENAVETVKGLLKRIRSGADIGQYMDKIYDLLDNLFNQLVMGDNILNCVYEDNEEEDHLPYHIVNVLILSSVVGLNAGFNKSRLSHLGLASIFYDIGMDSLRGIVLQPRELNNEESAEVRTHIFRSLETVERLNNINEVVKETINMHHERADGNGYPNGIDAAMINPYARILGLVDTYEAITHPRPHREGVNTHQAVRYLVGSLKNSFDADVMKIFINKMSVYPIGSVVELDTGEVARVISVKSGSPLRPIVMIIKGANGEHVDERTIIDLSEQGSPSVKD